MANVNIPAVATGAFLGLLAIIVLISCIPPVTRFLGDLCCCPWHIPFTKRRRRNDDEEMDKDDLPYVAGPPSPRVGSPVDDAGYHRVSAAYMSAVNIVDPELAKEEIRRSREYRRESSPYRAQQQHHPHRSQSEDYYYQQQQHHYDQRRSAYYQHPHSGANSGTHLQVPPSGDASSSPAHGWRNSSPQSRSPDRRSRMSHNYPPYEGGGGGGGGYGRGGYEAGYYDPYATSATHGGMQGGGDGYVDVQRPQHAYSPPEMSMALHHGHAAHEEGGYFPPRGGYDESGYYGGGSNNNSNSNISSNRSSHMVYEHHSSEYLPGPRQYPHPQV